MGAADDTVLSDNGWKFYARWCRHFYELFLQLKELEHHAQAG